jgi:hypothetical protein
MLVLFNDINEIRGHPRNWGNPARYHVLGEMRDGSKTDRNLLKNIKNFDKSKMIPTFIEPVNRAFTIKSTEHCNGPSPVPDTA